MPWTKWHSPKTCVLRFLSVCPTFCYFITIIVCPLIILENIPSTRKGFGCCLSDEHVRHGFFWSYDIHPLKKISFMHGVHYIWGFISFVFLMQYWWWSHFWLENILDYNSILSVCQYKVMCVIRPLFFFLKLFNIRRSTNIMFFRKELVRILVEIE